MESEILMSPPVWEGLSGKKIMIAGNEYGLRQRFWENLANIAGSMGNSFQVAAADEKADYAFLFAYPENMEQLMALLDQLKELAGADILAAVLISDNRVYGKLFGNSHPLDTDEIGYICHTMPEDFLAANLRTAEHYACRLAREEGLNIRVARASGDCGEDAAGEMAEAAVRVLLEGAAGDVYNLPMHRPETPKAHSPLEPIPIITIPELFLTRES